MIANKLVKLCVTMILCSLSALGNAVPFGPYDNTTAGAINGTTGCAGTELVRTINVPDNFIVDDLNVGFNASHTWRGDIVVTLESPAGTTVTIITDPDVNEDNDNYDFLLDSASGNPLDDGNNDNVAAPIYDADRTVAPTNSLNAFNSQAANGDWTLRVCDRFAGADDGTFNSARLAFDGTPSVDAPTIAKSFTPASIETGSVSTLSFTLSNSNNTALTAVNFVDNMPAELSLDNATIGGSCAGVTVSAGTLAGSSSITVTGGTIPANGSCTIDFSVTSVTVGTYNNTTGVLETLEAPDSAPSNTAVLTVTPVLLTAPTISKAFSPVSIRAGESTSMTFDIVNPNNAALTGVTFTDNMPRSIWLDSSTVTQTDCSGFAITSGDLGDSNITISGGTIPANTTCVLDIEVMSSVTGTHDNTTSGVASVEAALSNPSNTAQLFVSGNGNAVCTPGSLATGAIFASLDTGIYSINLETAKAELITTRAFNINGLAVNPENYIAYYNDNGAADGTIYGYDLLADTHFTVVPDVTALGVVLGPSGLNSAGAGFSNGSIYQGVEDVDDAYRIVLSDDGRSARYATFLFSMATAHDFGDFVVGGNELYDFDRANGANAFRRYSLVDFTIETTVLQGVAQGGAQRDGSTLWAVGDAIQVIDTDGVFQTTPVTITTDGTTPWGAAFDAGNCVVTTSRIGDLVWNDANGDQIQDANEAGIEGVTVELRYDLNSNGVIDTNDIVAATTTTAADGSYHFDNLTPDDYLVIVTDTANILNGAAPTNGALPRQITNLRINEERNNIDFGYRAFIVIEGGTVFNDNGVGGGVAHDGIVNGAEQGFESILVEVRDPNNADAVIVSTLTNAVGEYSLRIPNAFAGAELDLVVQSPAGHQSISELAAGVPGLINSDNRDDTIRFVPVAGDVYQNINFGDVLFNGFTPDHNGTLEAGQVTNYAHEFVAGSTGEVYFESSEVITPAALNWDHAIFRDNDCDANISPSESLAGAIAQGIGNEIPVVAGETICLISRVFAPTNAPFNSQYLVIISSTFNYIGETPDDLVSVLEVNDLTILSVSGLSLTKLVENVSSSGAPVTSNVALPGQQLRYTVTYFNNSSGDISTLIVRDSVPAFTGLFGPVLCPSILPNNLAACTVVQPAGAANTAGYNGPIEWSFSGSLAAGQGGDLSFDVLVE